jgi:hypothetical protein
MQISQGVERFRRQPVIDTPLPMAPAQKGNH